MGAKVRKKYFNIAENISSEQIYALLDNVNSDNEENHLLDNVNSDNEEKIGNLINDSDTEFIADEEMLPDNNTLDSSLTTLEANIYVLRQNEESKKPDKKKKESWKLTKKAKVNKQEPCALISELNEIVTPMGTPVGILSGNHSKLNDSKPLL